MSEGDWLLREFQKNRTHLERVALRMLGSKSEADDAVQEAWVRVDRYRADRIDNLRAWLTRVVARVCLDALRSRSARREVHEAGNREHPEPDPTSPAEADALLGESVGAALVVVLETLAPAERVAFVLHDMFDMTFEEIAPILGRSPVATRQLASRARKRVHVGQGAVEAETAHQCAIVRAFLAASRDGDIAALLALLAPDAVLRADAVARQTAAQANWADLPQELRGAAAIGETLLGRARGVRPAFIDGVPGAAFVAAGEVRGAWLFVLEDERIVETELVMDPVRIAQLGIALWP
jgi:RNA polymerase sigma factor (sigma-70 family)